MRIVLANKHFLGLAGGAERNIADIANWLSRSGHEVTILSETKYGEQPSFPVDSRVGIAAPKLRSADRTAPDRLIPRFAKNPSGDAWRQSTLSARRMWGSCIRAFNPDAIMTFMPHTSTMLLQELGDQYPILVTNQNDPAIDYYSDKHGSDPIDKHLRMESLEFASLVHFLLPEFVQKMPKFVQARAVVIPNAVPSSASLLGSIGGNAIIGIGRLVRQKGFALLIDAFAGSRARLNGWQLHIFGDGPEEENLRTKISRKMMQRSVMLHGHTRRPIEKMRRSEIFVIPSEYEGWGLALTEAMSCGLPCIGFRDCTGVNSLIKDGETGLLVERSPDALAQALDLLAANPSLRQSLGMGARTFVEQFHPTKVYPKWESALAQLARKS